MTSGTSHEAPGRRGARPGVPVAVAGGGVGALGRVHEAPVLHRPHRGVEGGAPQPLDLPRKLQQARVGEPVHLLGGLVLVEDGVVLGELPPLQCRAQRVDRLLRPVSAQPRVQERRHRVLDLGLVPQHPLGQDRAPARGLEFLADRATRVLVEAHGHPRPGVAHQNRRAVRLHLLGHVGKAGVRGLGPARRTAAATPLPRPATARGSLVSRPATHHGRTEQTAHHDRRQPSVRTLHPRHAPL